MKIAVFYNVAFGGAKRAVQEQVKGLKNLNHFVDVYTYDKEIDSFSPESYADNVYYYDFCPKTVQLPLISRLLIDLQVFYSLKYLNKKIAKDIDDKKYDIVLAHTDMYTQSPYVLRFLKTNNVYYCLEPLRMVYEYALRIPESLNMINKLYESVNRYIRKKIDRQNARSAMHSLALSYFGRDYMIQTYDIYANVSYLGVNADFFHPSDIKKKNQILFVAPKEYLFGYDLIDEALKLIPVSFRPKLKIVFGAEKARRITDDEVVKNYNESLVTVSLSKLDTFGLVPLESMACGTPVIAVNAAGYRELVIDGKTGFLIDFNPEELAEKIMLLVKNPKLASQLGREGRKWIEESWTWKKEIKKLEIFLYEFSKK